MTVPKQRSNKANLPAKRFARPNALKHGVFSAIEILPWEDPDLFEQITRDFYEEYKPEGPTQEDCVETLVWCRWRKLRLRAWRQLETQVALEKAENHVFAEEPSPLFDAQIEEVKHFLSKPPSERPNPPRDDYERLLRFSSNLYLEKSRKLVSMSLVFVPKEYREHLEKHVPESNFETTEAWIVAIKREIDTVLLPMVASRRPDAKGYKEAAAKFLASDRMMEDLALEERLDEIQGRALHRLYASKAHKQLERDRAQKLINGKVRS
jgi:hypothetical protein